MSTPFFIYLSYQNKKRPPEGGLIKNKDECYLSSKSMPQTLEIGSRISVSFSKENERGISLCMILLVCYRSLLFFLKKFLKYF
jgi:hypothetical protein